MKLRLQWDRSLVNQLKARGLEKALARALKKSGGDMLRKMRTQATKYTREKKALKAREVRKAFSLHFPKTSGLAGLSWTLRVKSLPTPLAAYPARQTRKGVNVEVNKGKRKLIQSAFVVTLKSGHKGVFVRRGKSRLPIDELFSSSVRQVFDDSELVPSLFADAQKNFSESFDRLLNVEISKAFAPVRQSAV